MKIIKNQRISPGHHPLEMITWSMIVLIFTNCSGPNRLIERGDKYVAENDLPNAQVKYSKALKLNPANPKPYEKIALLKQYQNDLKSSLEYLDRAIILALDDNYKRELRITRANTTVKLAEQVLSTNPFFNQNDYEEAFKQFQHSAEGTIFISEPDEKKYNQYLVEVKIALTKVAIEKNDFVRANYFINDLSLNDNLELEVRNEVFVLAADYYLGQEKYPEALIFFQQLFEQTSQSQYLERIESIYALLAKLSLENKQFNLATEYYRKLESLQPNKYDKEYSLCLLSHSKYIYENSHSIAIFKTKVKEYETSVGILKNLLTCSYPNAEEAKNYLEEIVLEIVEEALQNFSPSIGKQFLMELNFESLTEKNKGKLINLLIQVELALAKKSYDVKDYKKCIYHLHLITTQNPNYKNDKDFTALKVEAYLGLARVQFKQGNYQESLDFLNKILSELPENKEANVLREKIIRAQAKSAFSLGNSLFLKRDYEIAAFYLELSGKIHDSYLVKSNIRLNELYQKTLLVNKAVEALDRLLLSSQESDDTRLDKNHINYELAQLNCVKGDTVKAMSHLENLYCTSRYDDYYNRSKTDTKFFNLQKNKAFDLWSNGVQRIRFQFNYLSRITDLDKGPSISDPYLKIIFNSKSYTQLQSFTDVDSIWFNDIYLIVDVSKNDKLIIEAYDDDVGSFNVRLRGEDELIGSITANLFCESGNHKRDLNHARISYSIFRTMDKPNINGFSKSYRPLYVNTEFANKSCLQIGFEGVYALLRTQLSLYPFLAINIFEALAAQSQYATAGAVQDITSKYLLSRYASKDSQAFFKKYNMAEVLLETYLEMSKQDCLVFSD